jgi:ATP-dependent helicase/DNAse subunit B
MREEVSHIAGEVKRSLRGGAAADSILVTFPALDEYGPLVEEIFKDYGIPYNRALDRQLSTSPVITAVISLLRACLEDFSGQSLLRIFSSPFLKFAGKPSITPALDRLIRDQRIIGGKQKLLSALKYHTADKSGTDILSEPLKDLFSALEPFSRRDAAPLSSWMERLANLIAWAGLGARVSTIKGPLNINLQAYHKLNEGVSSLAIAGKQFPEYRYTFGEWLFLLKKTFMQTRFQVPPEDEGGVQVLGLDESMGLPWNEIYLGGLVDGKFPRRLPQNIFLPEQTLEALGVRTLERARLNASYHFYRLILSAPKVTLTYPESEGDKPVVRSPFLEELTPLKNAGLINRGIKETSRIQFSLKIKDSNSIPELAKAISIAGTVKGLDTVFRVDIEGLSGIKSATEYKPTGSIPAVIPSARREFSVTELDDYLSCPYDYYIKHVLRIQPLDEVTEDISPLDRGSKVHGILKKFYNEAFGKRPITRENRDEARVILKKLADASFDREADTFRNRREKERFVVVMAERFLDAEEEFWKQGMRPEHLEQKIERYRLVLSDGEEVDISATIDRIDVDESGNFIIVDYKTGIYPLPKMNIEQDIFQLPVYAVMAQQSLQGGAGHAVPLRKPIGLAYYDLKGKTGAGARDVVLFNKDVRDDQPSSKPKASPKSAEDFETILEQSMDKARKAVESILAGVFPALPQDENKCRYCPNEMMCGIKIS